MSTAATALTFSIGAILGAGWTQAFAKATKSCDTLADKSDDRVVQKSFKTHPTAAQTQTMT